MFAEARSMFCMSKSLETKMGWAGLTEEQVEALLCSSLISAAASGIECLDGPERQPEEKGRSHASVVKHAASMMMLTATPNKTADRRASS